ncbi:MAG: hypothetical protein ACHQ9S_09945 [Candidatus Binatia bacterium]
MSLFCSDTRSETGNWKSWELFLLACAAIALVLHAIPASAGQGRHAVARPATALAVRGRVRVLEGRIVAVRRLSREVTMRTPEGAVRHVTIPREAKVQARGAAGLNAVHTGGVVRLDAVADRNGKLLARSVAVH